MTEDEIADEIAVRCLRLLKLRHAGHNTFARVGNWAIETPAPTQLCVYDESPDSRTFLVFNWNGTMPPYENSERKSAVMDRHICENFLLPDLRRELVLEDLAASGRRDHA